MPVFAKSVQNILNLEKKKNSYVHRGHTLIVPMVCNSLKMCG